MKILVTGAGGFVGTHLVKLLAARGDDVVALVRKPPTSEQARFLSGHAVRVLELDLTSPDFARLPAGMEAMVALAQSLNFRNFPDKAEEIFAVNASATLRLLEWARRAGVQRFVLASSGGIYGARARPLVEETDLLAVDSPLGFYLGTKLCAEVIFQNYRQFFGGAVILRPFFIYGPGQRPDMLIPRLIASVREGQPIQLQGADGLRLNPVYVDDAVQAFASALKLAGFHVLNVAGPEVLTLREIGERIARKLGRTGLFESVEGAPSDYVADTERMTAVLGAPRTGFEEGIARTLEAR